MRITAPGLAEGSAWRVLRQRDYRRYVGGNACSNLGTWLQNTAQALLAYHLTRSAGGVAAVTVAQFAGVLVLGPCVGVVVDRFDRRRLLLIAQALSGAVAGGLAALEFGGLLTQDRLVAGAAGIGVVYAFAFPAQSAIVPSLVPPADVRAAMAMNVVSDNVGRALAPAAGVIMISTIGFGWAFALNSLSFAVFFSALMRVRCRPPAAGRAALPRRLGFLDGLRVGIRTVRVRQLLVIAAITTVATDPIMVLGPSLAHNVLHAPAVRAGYFIAAFGVGTVVGAMVRVERVRLRHQLTSSVIVLFSAVLVYLKGPTFAFSAGAAFVAGMAFLIALAATQTLLIGRSHPQRVGSMMAVWAFAHAGSRPPASLLDGRLADTMGAQRAGYLILAGGACILAWAAAPELRRISGNGLLRALPHLHAAPAAAVAAPAAAAVVPPAVASGAAAPAGCAAGPDGTGRAGDTVADSFGVSPVAPAGACYPAM